MSRPYMTYKITDLEALFAKPEIDDATLAKLAHELGHRGVPRAVVLLEKVERRQKARRSEKASARKPVSGDQPTAEVLAESSPRQPAVARELTTPPVQHSLTFNEPRKAQPASASAPMQTPASAPKPELEKVAPIASLVIPPIADRAVLSVINPGNPSAVEHQAGQSQDISPAEAYALLQLAPGAPWDLVEKHRRELVERSSPIALRDRDSETRAHVLATAKRINAAYAVVGSIRLSS